MAMPRRLLMGPSSLNRRAWLKIGGLSLGALVSGIEPSLARLCLRGLSPLISAALLLHCANRLSWIASAMALYPAGEGCR